MARLRVDTTSPVDWRYTAEGGANLVLSYAGTANPELQGHALRLRKRKRVARPEGAIPDQVDVEFGGIIVRPLLGQDLCLDAQIVPLSVGWLQSMADSLAARKDRPPKRVQEDDVDIAAGKGVLVEDLIAGTGSLSVEIKPKWGFLPTSTHLSLGTADVKSAYCRTCMHRALKRAPRSATSEEGGTEPARVAGGDDFCPLDLYSRDPARISRALRQLYSSWSDSDGGINNLRFFLDGKLVKPSKLPSHFNETMLSSTASDLERANRFDSFFTPILLASPILPRLAALQSSLDPLDIEGLAARIRDELGLDLYRLDLTEDEVASKLGGQPTTQEWQAWLERWQQRTTSSTLSCEQETPLRDLVLAYLLSATFKDCSIFLRLDWPPPSLDIGSTSTACERSAVDGLKIKVIDLDPKPIARMGKYARMDREITEHWRDSVLANGGSSRSCARPA